MFTTTILDSILNRKERNFSRNHIDENGAKYIFKSHKVLHLACAANCIAGTILAITPTRKGNAQTRLRA